MESTQLLVQNYETPIYKTPVCMQSDFKTTLKQELLTASKHDLIVLNGEISLTVHA